MAMDVLEKIAYLKGNMDGLELDSSKKETKILSLITDVLDEMAKAYIELRDENEDMKELLDILDEDLGYVEEIVFEEYDSGDECECCGHGHRDNDDDDDDDMSVYVKCPECDDAIYIDEDILNDGGLECPNCGEDFEFDLSDVKSDDDNDNMPF